MSPSGDLHPGEIVFEDQVEGTQRTAQAAEVPKSIAWARNSEGLWVAVTRVEASGTPDRREIKKFGPAGQFLEATVQSAPRPTPQRPRARSPRPDAS